MWITATQRKSTTDEDKTILYYIHWHIKSENIPKILNDLKFILKPINPIFNLFTKLKDRTDKISNTIIDYSSSSSLAWQAYRDD